MTTLLLILSLFGPIDRERFLYAISAVESNHNPKAIGRAGEVGAHQMTRAAIKDGKTAVGFFTVTTNRMAHLKVSITPNNTALAWNHGITGAKRRRWKPTDYSKRVSNLYLAQPAAIPKPSRTPHVHSSARAVPSIK